MPNLLMHSEEKIMMSIGVVKSGTDVHKYFTDKDNYYLTDKSELKEAVTWYGKGSELLGIKGEKIDKKLLLDCLMEDFQMLNK